MSSSAERQPLVRQQPQAAPGAAPAPFADPAPAAALAISQDAALDASSQSVVNAYDRMLQEKERMILENIARKRSNIYAVERQLSELQLALHINVGPRRQALEHLRSLIEQQSHRIDDACTHYKKAKQEMEHRQKQMEEGQQHKERLAAELNMLVQQSAGAQLKKLEELSEELEHLTGDHPAEVAAANGAQQAGGSGAGDAAMPVAPQPQPSAAAGQQLQQQQMSHKAGEAAGQQTAQELEEQQRQRQLQQQRQAAATGRARHVQLLPGRKAGSSDDSGSGSRVCATRIPTAPAASNGPFQGFE